MEDVELYTGMLEKVQTTASVENAIIMTKTGIFVTGTGEESLAMERFAGMTAILMGSASVISEEMGDSVKWVAIQMKASQIATTILSDDFLLAVELTGTKFDDSFLKNLEKITDSISRDLHD